MRIQKLIIHNIASIEDAEINFEAQPLSNSDVFLITGKTGAGKSTILDAICLALYNDTPRLSNTSMEGETRDEHGTGKSIQMDDVRQLMRRNKAEASVTLYFTGNNGVHYESKWSLARARQRVDGTLQDSKWQLTNLDTGIVFDRKREVGNEIANAVGLDFSQFCRTTMLAQGEFTRFLNSKDEEKANILEKITGVDIYTRIGKKIFEITSEKKDQWALAQQRVEGVTTLSAEQIEEKQREIAEIKAKFEAEKTQKKSYETKRDWLKTDKEIAENVVKYADNMQRAKSALDSDEFKAVDTTVKQWRATIDARQWLVDKNNAETTVTALNADLEKLQADFAAMLGGIAYVEGKLEALASEQKEVKQYLDEEQERAEIYANSQTIVSKIETIANCRKTIAKEKGDIEKEEDTLKNKLEPEYQKAKTIAQDAVDSLTEKQEELKKRDDEVKALQLPQLRYRHSAAKDLLRDIELASSALSNLDSARRRRADNKENLANKMAEIDKKREQLAALEPEVENAKSKEQASKELLDKQKDTVDKYARTMRQKLHKGDHCPVCGQVILEALPHEDEFRKLYKVLEDNYKADNDEYNKLLGEENKLKASIDVMEKEYKAAKNTFDKDSSVVDAEQKAAEECRKCGVDTLDDTVAAQLSQLKEETTRTSTLLDKQIKEGEKKEDKVAEMRKVVEEKQKEAERLRENEREALKASTDCVTRIEASMKLVNGKKSEESDAESKVTAMLNGKWEGEWRENLTGFSNELKNAASQYERSKQRMQQISNQIDTQTNNYNQVKVVLDRILEQKPEWAGVTPAAKEERTRLLSDSNDLRTRLTTTLTQLHQAQETIKGKSAQLAAFYADNSGLNEQLLEKLNALSGKEIDLKADEVNSKRNEAKTAEQMLIQERNRRTQLDQNKPELAEDDTVEALQERVDSTEKVMAELNTDKGAIEQILTADNQAKQELGALIAEVESRKKEYDKWQRLNDSFGSADGKKFRKVAQSYVLANLIHSANSYMATLSGRYTLKVVPGSFVIQIEDAYQGYVTRAASTISGGESFLVSLALALALSDIGQQLAVDTLFIDEGFGTLSGEPLQGAINTLRSLHSLSGRHVGIISHVEELRERIPVQIQVNQEGQASSSTVTVVPQE